MFPLTSARNVVLLAGLLCLLGARPSPAATGVRTNLFFTGFERHEGYDPELTLAGQNGWLHVVLRDNINLPALPATGIASNAFDGLGQQGYVGGLFIQEPVDSASVWHPVILDPVPAATPVVRFSVLFEIVDSSIAHYDNFRWSVFNTEIRRLFSLDFDNNDFTITYLLDSGGFVDTGQTFELDAYHHLELAMNFAANTWQAWLNGVPLVTNAPITTTAATLNLGEVDAVWVNAEDRNNWGDNYMVFDNYHLWAEPEPTEPVPPSLLLLSQATDGLFALRLMGTPDQEYLVEASDDFRQWTEFGSGRSRSGLLDFVDPSAGSRPQRFFRARELAP